MPRRKKKRSRSIKTEIKQCLICGIDIVVQNSRKDRKKFCSKECLHQAMRHGAEINCSVCGKSFWLRQSNIDCGITTCSPECIEWKHAEKIKVESLDYMWATIVKTRAGFKCEYCGSIKRPNAHHIYSRSVWPVRWNLDNGICLCVKHHILAGLSAHKSPLLFADWIREDRGDNWNKRLLEEVKHGAHPDRVIEFFRLKYWEDQFILWDNPDVKDWDWDLIPTVDLRINPVL